MKHHLVHNGHITGMGPEAVMNRSKRNSCPTKPVYSCHIPAQLIIMYNIKTTNNYYFSLTQNSKYCSENACKAQHKNDNFQQKSPYTEIT